MTHPQVVATFDRLAKQARATLGDAEVDRIVTKYRARLQAIQWQYLSSSELDVVERLDAGMVKVTDKQAAENLESFAHNVLL